VRVCACACVRACLRVCVVFACVFVHVCVLVCVCMFVCGCVASLWSERVGHQIESFESSLAGGMLFSGTKYT